MTALLLLAVFAFSPDLSPVNDLALDPSFIKSIGTYIGVADPSVRRCGMLLAEAVAQRAGKKLAFDGWDGDHEELRWCRALRELVEMRDTDVALDIDEAQAAKEEVKSKGTTSSTLKIVDSDDEDETEPVSRSRTQKSKVKDDVPADTYDSDDSLTGYASEDPSSRAPSPTPSELEEIEKDPSLNVGVKKIARPVYLVQLGQLLWPTTISQGEDEGEADRIQMGLDSAEELIRRKKDYGTELGKRPSFEMHRYSDDYVLYRGECYQPRSRARGTCG
jgi:telomere length regulation protein